MQHTRVSDGFELSQTRRTLPMALLRARELVMDQFRPLLRAHGVTEQQWRVLRVLQEADGMDASQLASAANILAPSLTRILRTMTSQHLVDVRKDSADGRRSLIKLSQRGSELLYEVAPHSAQIYAALEVKLGRRNIDQLLDALEDVILVLSDARDGGIARLCPEAQEDA
ncbi:MAG: homoprotocatechuate degradation operon regulator HpaR [Ahrensia sp.]|nr:homoprotocatechuate degradation operon regulator HpaR [Ahrensia sp.]